MAKRRVKSDEKAPGVTVPDLVVLSLLDERPMHGYEVNAELERRQVRDWAGVSRPQIYYSMDKLERVGLVAVREADAPAHGPERRVLGTTPAGRRALAEALERPDWTSGRDRPPFLTWMALSWRARPGVFAAQLAARRAFLESELARERGVLADVKREVGHDAHEAIWMLTLAIEQFRTEVRWIDKVASEAPKRAPAKR